MPSVEALPTWERGTPAVLCVAGPHAIPVSTALRAGDRRVLFALGRRRDTLARLREDPRAALCVMGERVAFTAHGRVAELSRQLGDVPVVALELRVERVQDHLADGRTEMIGGARWRWRDAGAARADELVVAGLRRLAGV